MDPTIEKFINCMSAAALTDKFSSTMPTAPNIPLLHNALHSAISLDKLEGARFIAIAIKLLAKKDQRENVWKRILNKDALLTNASGWGEFTWESYFAEDIARRKKKNEKERNESILHLYKSGTISMFRAIEHPKLFFALLKLGADPFQRNSMGKTLSLAIAESSTLVKTRRLHLLQQMLKKNILTVEPSGPDFKSPIEVCVGNQKDSLKYLVQVPGIENLKVKDRNVLVLLGTEAEGLMQYFSVPQLIKLLGERYEGKLVATRLTISKMPDHWNFAMAIKELIQNNPNLLPELKNHGIHEKVLINFMLNGKNTTPEEDQLAKQMRKMQLEQFWGNTEFNLAELPAELLDMVTAHLGSEDQVRLWSVSKALKSMMSDYTWQQMIKVDAPMLYRQLEHDKKKTWPEKAAPRIKSAFHWKVGKYVSKKLRTPPSPVQIHPRTIDEYWFASTQGKKLHLWNLSNGSAKIFKLSEEAQKVEFMTTDAYEVPPLIFSQYQNFGWRINNTVTEMRYSGIGIPEGDRCLINLSDNRILVNSNTFYDINRQRTFTVNDKYGRIMGVKFNPLNNMFVGLTSAENITIMDKDLNTVSHGKWSVNAQSMRNGKVHILDEYTVIAVADTSQVFDLRTMKAIKTLPRVVYNGAGRGIEQFINFAPFGMVWNFRTMESESCLVFPNRTRTQYTEFVCNSKLVIFSTGIPYSLNSLMF